uniref:Uncharacterized protein n=1 Tax=Kalanchoe fedtschenkoi TaxID=63787 RepID=A0A7N0TQZ2_KALFE
MRANHSIIELLFCHFPLISCALVLPNLFALHLLTTTSILLSGADPAAANGGKDEEAKVRVFRSSRVPSRYDDPECLFGASKVLSDKEINGMIMGRMKGAYLEKTIKHIVITILGYGEAYVSDVVI